MTETFQILKAAETMRYIRRLTCDDLFNFNAVNLDYFTETVNLDLFSAELLGPVHTLQIGSNEDRPFLCSTIFLSTWIT